MDNPCKVCVHRWTLERQVAEDGHCYMWRAEPMPCPRHAFKLDEWEFQRDMARQLLAQGTTPTVTGEQK